MSEQLDQLQEFDASGSENKTMDPIDTKVAKRKADKNPPGDKAEKVSDGVNKEGGDLIDTVTTKKSPSRAADKTMGEHVSEMFDGEDLTEEFKEKASVIFEAAVNEKVSAKILDIQEQFDNDLVEQVTQATEELVEKIDSYFDYLTTRYMEENALAIEAGIKSEIAESLLEGLKSVFVEHNIDIPEESVDIVAEMAEQIEMLESKLNEEIDSNIELNKVVNEALRNDVIDEISEGLAQTQVEKLKVLTEDLEYEDIDSFKRKATIIKEKYFGSNSKNLTEELEELNSSSEIGNENNVRYIDPDVAAFAKSISRSFGKS